mmetsp:Transcript_2917/g.9948  ORF Transcript_2917/g.9948 Transcript_2917/m.9948 type:complete len:266 (+) Transcript_2917:756-1553(+)
MRDAQPAASRHKPYFSSVPMTRSRGVSDADARTRQKTVRTFSFARSSRSRCAPRKPVAPVKSTASPSSGRLPAAASSPSAAARFCWLSTRFVASDTPCQYARSAMSKPSGALASKASSSFCTAAKGRGAAFVALPPPAMNAASPRIVGRSKSAATLTSTPSRALSLATSFVARRLWPPMSKKDSSGSTMAMGSSSTSAQSSATKASVSPWSAKAFCADSRPSVLRSASAKSRRPGSVLGKAACFSLPEMGCVGSSSMGTTNDGTM